ncbi:BnaC05g50740D [Brassica napus]|uniref:(rape) hypothetical protein n=1 Tax=Brassica napus TaxID=3708 RepID=A0A078JYQ7_BRANA|nr:unnamed protein product [Brassica napus]CDY71799.1 BnaC05g50740D [Brassica napus]
MSQAFICYRRVLIILFVVLPLCLLFTILCISHSYLILISQISFLLHDNNRENINHAIRLKYHYILGQEFLIECVLHCSKHRNDLLLF